MFHIIRAFHVAGRCTDCGECSRVCPQNIPLHLLNRKFIKDINTFYGAYQAGEDTESRAPLTNYTKGDAEPSIVYHKGGERIMFQLPIDKLQALFAAVAAKETLYIPADDAAGQPRYQRWQEGLEMTKALNTVRSAKDFFFPQTEDLVDFKVKGKEIEIIDPRTEQEDFVIFGVRACDARSFTILDKVFLAPPVDSYYKSRREHGTVVTMACTHPGGRPASAPFSALIQPSRRATRRCWMDDAKVYMEAITEKGEKLIGSLSELLTEGGADKVAAQQQETRAIVEKLPFHELSLKGFGGENMLKLFDAPEWKTLSQSCLGCGACTFVCPTCQCYDIRDFDTGHGS